MFDIVYRKIRSSAVAYFVIGVSFLETTKTRVRVKLLRYRNTKNPADRSLDPLDRKPDSQDEIRDKYNKNLTNNDQTVH